MSLDSKWNGTYLLFKHYGNPPTFEGKLNIRADGRVFLEGIECINVNGSAEKLSFFYMGYRFVLEFSTKSNTETPEGNCFSGEVSIIITNTPIGTCRGYTIETAKNLALALMDREYTTQDSASPYWPNKINNTFVFKASWAGDTDGRNDPYFRYVPMLNKHIRYRFGSTDFSGGRSDIIATVPAVIDPSNWMGQLWPYLSEMPLNACVIPGCHDALTGYAPLGFSTSRSFTQSRTLPKMLNDGCRYLDLRFCNPDVTNAVNHQIANYQGWHSKVNFFVTVEEVLNILKAFINAHPKEIVIINLQLLSSLLIGNDADQSVYEDFMNHAVSLGLGNMLIAPGTPSMLIKSLNNQNGGLIFLISESWSTSGNSNLRYYWNNMKVDDVNWTNNSSDNEQTPQEWYSVIMEKGYLSSPMINGGLFHHLSMTQTGGVPDDVSRQLNGPLADWILYANPDVEPTLRPNRPYGISTACVNQLDLFSFNSQFTLPYKCFEKTGQYKDNYNLISMDYYERSAFIINSIAQNLLIYDKRYKPRTA